MITDSVDVDVPRAVGDNGTSAAKQYPSCIQNLITSSLAQDTFFSPDYFIQNVTKE